MGETKEGGHFPNFIACVRSRKREHLRALVEEGHISCGLDSLGECLLSLGKN